jgi:hypothetical protein
MRCEPVRRTPKDYDGCEPTGHHIRDLLPALLQGIGAIYRERPDLIFAAWPEIIGPQLAPMTEVLSFEGGILTVKVRNSTLHSLLSQHDRHRILQSLRDKFPSTRIHNINFRIG